MIRYSNPEFRSKFYQRKSCRQAFYIAYTASQDFHIRIVLIHNQAYFYNI